MCLYSVHKNTFRVERKIRYQLNKKMWRKKEGSKCSHKRRGAADAQSLLFTEQEKVKRKLEKSIYLLRADFGPFSK